MKNRQIHVLIIRRWKRAEKKEMNSSKTQRLKNLV
jgi:hypothetical protein